MCWTEASVTYFRQEMRQKLEILLSAFKLEILLSALRSYASLHLLTHFPLPYSNSSLSEQ